MVRLKIGKIYRVEDHNNCWIIRYKGKGTKEEGFGKLKADIIARKDFGVFEKPSDYKDRLFCNLKTFHNFDVKDLPLYVNYYLSPLFQELLT